MLLSCMLDAHAGACWCVWRWRLEDNLRGHSSRAFRLVFWGRVSPLAWNLQADWTGCQQAVRTLPVSASQHWGCESICHTQISSKLDSKDWTKILPASRQPFYQPRPLSSPSNYNGFAVVRCRTAASVYAQCCAGFRGGHSCSCSVCFLLLVC